MTKVWKVLPKKSDDLIDQLLQNRGINSTKEKELFFNPKLENFQKELSLPGVEKSKKRISEAIKKNELIVVYGDYDVDGICASAILYKALTSIGAKVLPYIPHREKEGYGLSNTGLEFARDSGASIVITVDNGIVAIEQAKFAKNLGLDLIITDHHLPLDEKPDAYSIVHSTKMCGAGVAWCLIFSLVSKDLSKDLLQFVAIATVCDLIPLVGLGRAFLKEGLRVLNRTNNLGLKSLSLECNIDLKNAGSYEIGHIIGPRLNAIGRLEHAIDALRLLCTKDEIKARKLAKLLCDANLTRQKLTIDALDEAQLKLDKNKKIHILFDKKWSQGIIGLVAGRICEQTARPAIAISVGELVAKGSARSINGVNIVEIIRQCSDMLIDIGGHPGAAGFSLKSENIEIFKNRIEKLVVDLPEEVEEVLEIEAEVSVKQLTKKLVDDLERLEPFGFGNPKPVLATRGLRVSDIRTVGEGKHLKFKVDDSEWSRGTGNIDAIAFGMGSMENLLRNGQLVDLAYNLEINRYNGSEKLQLKVKDIKIN